jgi:Transcriptional regulatory protein, C terminal
MDTMPSQPRVVKFGVFEVDLTAGEVRKAGMRQKLAGQPFQVLQVLLEHPQEIVTREELRERLWPGNTFVDYELGLKKAVTVRKSGSRQLTSYLPKAVARGWPRLAAVSASKQAAKRYVATIEQDDHPPERLARNGEANCRAGASHENRGSSSIIICCTTSRSSVAAARLRNVGNCTKRSGLRFTNICKKSRLPRLSE